MMGVHDTAFTWVDASGQEQRWYTEEVQYLESAASMVKITRRSTDGRMSTTVLLDGAEAVAFIAAYHRAIGLPPFGTT